MRTFSRSTVFLVVTPLICSVPTFPAGNESHFESDSSSEQHCASVQRQQDDTTVFLQAGRIQVETLGGQDIEEQTRPVEDIFLAEQLRRTKFAAPLSLSQQGHGKTILNPLKNFMTSMLTIVSRIPSAHEAVTGSSSIVVIAFIVPILLCTVIAAIGVLLANYNKQGNRTYLRTNDMMSFSSTSREHTGQATGTMAAMSGRPHLPSPLPQQIFEPVRRTQSQSSSISQQYGSQASPFRMNPTFMPPPSWPALASGLPNRAPDNQLAVPMSKCMPPPLCPALVLPACEAHFGVPLFELSQLSSEGELSIVGLSRNILLRASVRKVGRQCSLEISMPEAGSAPRITIAPNIQDLNRPDDSVLEIRGLQGSLYGMLELRASGVCRVTKDGETILIIEGDADSLRLIVKSGDGMPLASVRCSSEPFGGVDHIEIQVEKSVDTVLVLGCVLAVLLLSPTA